jgi:FkbM family methyltransferase
MIKKVIKKIISEAGYQLVKKDNYDKDNLYNNWQTVKRKDLKINTCIDVGVGYGTFELYKLFPNAYHLLIEPNENYSEIIRNILTNYNGKWIPKAAGSETGAKEFQIFNDYPEKSGLLNRKKIAKRNGQTETKKIEVDTLDNIFQEGNYESPFYLKIDVEGYELEALKGATNILKSTQFVIIEAPIIERFNNAYNLFELTEFMLKNGFYITDFIDIDRGSVVKYADFIFYKI